MEQVLKQTSTIEEIEKIIGSELAYLVVVDKKGNQTALTFQNTEVFTPDMPIKTQAITSLDSAAFMSYQGSCIYCYKVNGVLKCVSYPC